VQEVRCRVANPNWDSFNIS